MSGFDVAAIAKDLQVLVGGFVDKVYHREGDELLVRINVRGEAGKRNLLARSGRWVCMPEDPGENPQTPSSFAMLLRKHVLNGTVAAISQAGFDRLITIDIQKAESFSIVIELFGDGNAVLTREGVILGVLHPHTWSSRTLRVGREYAPPPARCDPSKVTRQEFDEALRGSRHDLVRALAVDVNLGGPYAEEVCLRAGLEKNSLADAIDAAGMDALYAALGELMDGLAKPEPVIYSEEGGAVAIAPFPMRRYGGLEAESYPTFNAAAVDFFTWGDDSDEPEEVHDPRKDEAARLRRQFEQQSRAVGDLEAEADEQNRLAGVLYENYGECEKVLDTLKKAAGTGKLKEVDAEALQEHGILALDMAKKTFIYRLGDNDLKLDYTRDVNGNAQLYYARSKRAKEKMEGATSALETTRASLERLEKDIEESPVQPASKGKGKRRTRKRFWFESYRWFITSNGNIVVAGRDASSNDRVVKKYLKDRDRYAHADIHGAPSVVVKTTEGADIAEATLEEACTFALAQSKAWKAGVGSGSAYWVKPDQVSKTPQSGEFLAKGAFIVRGKRNYVHNIPMELAVGEMTHEGERMVMCGPESAVREMSGKYVVIRPGDIQKNRAARALADLFDVDMEDVAKVMPPGDVAYVRGVGVDVEELGG